MKRVTKSEMKQIFKKHGLKLGFPCNARHGSCVTDWNYHYHRVGYYESDLYKFENLIKTEYANTYRLFNDFTHASTGVERNDTKKNYKN